MQRILFVIAKNGFQPDEYFIPKEIIEKAGHDIKTASNLEAGEFAISSTGEKVKIDFSLENVNVEDFDGLVFIGGSGAPENLDNEKSYRLIKEAFQKNKLVAGICIAPTILAKAGILNGKKATVWSSNWDKEPIEILESKGANYTGDDVSVDGNIITACGPIVASEFGEKIKNYFA